MGIKSVSGRWMKAELLGFGALLVAACATGVEPIRPGGGGGDGAGGDPSVTTTGDVVGSSTSNTTGDFTTSTTATTSSASSSSASSSTGGVVMGLALQYRAADVNATDNQMKPHFRIWNGGTTSVPLSSLTIRYYFTSEGNPPQVFECDYATVGCGNLAGV
ncbi:MAG: cellulose binding domain-containing protein, partial [Byssovorax sp.]